MASLLQNNSENQDKIEFIIIMMGFELRYTAVKRPAYPKQSMATRKSNAEVNMSTYKDNALTILEATLLSSCIAWATFVRGPSAKIVTSPGWAAQASEMYWAAD